MNKPIITRKASIDSITNKHKKLPLLFLKHQTILNRGKTTLTIINRKSIVMQEKAGKGRQKNI